MIRFRKYDLKGAIKWVAESRNKRRLGETSKPSNR